MGDKCKNALTVIIAAVLGGFVGYGIHAWQCAYRDYYDDEYEDEDDFDDDSDFEEEDLGEQNGGN